MGSRLTCDPAHGNIGRFKERGASLENINEVRPAGPWIEGVKLRLAAEALKLLYSYEPIARPGETSPDWSIVVKVPESKAADLAAELKRPDLLDGMRIP